MSAGDYPIARSISVLHRYGQVYISKKLEGHGVGSGQHGILLTLFRRGGVSQEELADVLKTDKGCIAKSLKKLELEGYVERCADADDKRANKVYLTQKALDIIPEVRRVIEGWEAFIASGLSEEEKMALEGLLRRMAETVTSARDMNGETTI